jgi:polysaccharide deacetylase family protein (PEP-CTERM system associated)
MTSQPGILTIDVEEWFHGHNYLERIQPGQWEGQDRRAESGVQRLLDLCDELSIRATWFLLGWQAERQPQLARKIAERGHEIGCHTYAHPIIYTMQPDAFRADTIRARDVIADAIGKAPTLYRGASFTITRKSYWALQILAEAGFRVDSSIFPVLHPRYGNPRGPRRPFRLGDAEGLLVMPITTLRLLGCNLPFSGGGYFRLLPLGVVRSCAKIVRERQREPVVYYFHPWELDETSPSVRLGLLAQLRSQGGKRDLFAKLRMALRDQPMTTLGEYAARIRDTTPIVPSL